MSAVARDHVILCFGNESSIVTPFPVIAAVHFDIMSNEDQGVLYVVATPIGNLGDISQRALDTLASVDRIAAEDTRHSGRLLSHFGIQKPLLALHEHNETARLEQLLSLLQAGESLALISDAGTPLISDPGFKLVRALREQGIRVIPIPGASALIAALSVSGLPTDRFVFEGFLSAKTKARQDQLHALVNEQRTLIFYESSHRIGDLLRDLGLVFGPARPAVIARELTKLYEQVVDGSLADLAQWLEQRAEHQKGEFVVIVQGAEPVTTGDISPEDQKLLRLLANELPPRKAAAIVADFTGKKKKPFYEWLVAQS